MKQKLYALAYILAVLCILSACREEQIPERHSHTLRTLHIEASTAHLRSLRVLELSPDRRDISYRLETGRASIQVLLRQGDDLHYLGYADIKSVEQDGRLARFDVQVPRALDYSKPFDLIACIAPQLRIIGKRALVRIDAHSIHEISRHSSIRNEDIPVWAIARAVEASSLTVSLDFEHLGSVAVVTLANLSDKPFRSAGLGIVPIENNPAFYYKASLPFVGDTELPYLDLLSSSTTIEMLKSEVRYPELQLEANGVRTYGFWFRPMGNAPRESVLQAYDIDTRRVLNSVNTLRERTQPFELGKAYHISAEWTGTELRIR